ncbi:hypothetical protein Slala02_58870 [Streptomyces lavendulae subsp. lavendulae]|nr:hypothetical protein Slala01_62280 [Streptomyces lavendulae subsp. lavendulae]GLX30067.1 hypothetical protein Slala02_58870 [Streptomyces lavendulae subsp. lavendulae]
MGGGGREAQGTQLSQQRFVTEGGEVPELLSTCVRGHAVHESLPVLGGRRPMARVQLWANAGVRCGGKAAAVESS